MMGSLWDKLWVALRPRRILGRLLLCPRRDHPHCRLRPRPRRLHSDNNGRRRHSDSRRRRGSRYLTLSLVNGKVDDEDKNFDSAMAAFRAASSRLVTVVRLQKK